MKSEYVVYGDKHIIVEGEILVDNSWYDDFRNVQFALIVNAQNKALAKEMMQELGQKE